MPSAVSTTSNRPEFLVQNLISSSKSNSGNNKLLLFTSLREIKNQIIGNKTKKLLYLRLGAVPKIISILKSESQDFSRIEDVNLLILVQAAAAVGSFACGMEEGVKAVVENGAIDCLVRILDCSNEKVIDAGARSLRIIFQSKLAPKFEFLQEKNMKFIVSLINNENENVRELGASIISHSCHKSSEQNALCEVGVLERLATLLKGSLHQRDSYLDSIAAMVRSNSEVATKFASINNGKALVFVTDLVQDKSPRTRLLASLCLIAIGHAAPCCVQEFQIKTKLMLTLVELLEEPDKVGDDAPFAFLELIYGEEELHKQAGSINAIEKLYNFLCKGKIHHRRLEGILLALAELCSMLEECRCQLISLQVVDKLVEMLKHDSADVCTAACTCIKSISRSIKKLSAGTFSNERLVNALIELLNDKCTYVQVAALEATCNVVVNFPLQKSVFIESDGVTQLLQLSNSMDLKVRLKSLCALRNLMFLRDGKSGQRIMSELKLSSLVFLINDSEPLIQEQALGLLNNFVDGSIANIGYLFEHGSNIIDAVVRQLHYASSCQVCIQGMFFLSNIAAGDENHKDTILNNVICTQADGRNALVINFLQSKNNLLRTASLWCVVNLTHPLGSWSSTRVLRLHQAGVISQIKKMVNDPFLDCKFRARMILMQCTAFESKLA